MNLKEAMKKYRTEKETIEKIYLLGYIDGWLESRIEHLKEINNKIRQINTEKEEEKTTLLEFNEKGELIGKKEWES